MNNKYIIQTGPAKGLINRIDVDNAIIDEVTERIRPTIKNANDLSDVELQRDLVSQVIKDFEGKVFKGSFREQTKTEEGIDESGARRSITTTVKVPNTTSPSSFGLNYTKNVLSIVERDLIRTFKPYTPTLDHNPDKKAFAIAASKLFPNVYGPWEAAEALRQFFENIHNSCHTPGAAFKQTCLWLFSFKTGFTGKSHFLSNLEAALADLDIDCFMGGFDKDWFDPVNALHTVMLVNDLDTLPSVHVINGLIDRTTFHYNKKGGATGNVTSCTNLVVTANIAPFKQNRRRYNVIQFPGISVDRLSPEEKAYFPFWGRDDEYQACIKDLIRTCPFSSPYCNPNANEKVERSEQYADVLTTIQREVKAMIANNMPTKMFPPQFASHAYDLNTTTEVKEFKQQLNSFLAQAQNERKLDEQGTYPAWRREIEFKQFLKWENGFADTPNGVNWLEDIHNQWQDLIDKQ